MKRSEGRAHALLDAYTDLLAHRGVTLGIIAKGDLPRLKERHVMDSARAAALVPVTAATAADIGSGAGLPGIPVAILCPQLRITLLEPRRKRAAFLEFAISELGIANAGVLARRAEGSELRVDVALARAVGDAPTSWRLAEPLLTDGGVLIYFAGRSWSAEMLDALASLGASAFVPVQPRADDVGPLVMMRRASNGA